MSIHEINEEAGRAAAPVPAGKTPTAYYTYILMACIIVVAIVQHASGLERSLQLAAFDKPLFRMGEYWRILTGTALHVDPVHIAFNAYALYVYGKLVELLSNRAHVPLIFLLAALGGDILSLIFLPGGSSVGASGGIIGLLGFLVVYGFKRKQFLSPDFIRNMLINTAILIVVGLGLNQVIDNYAHLGGFITGAVYALTNVPGDPHIDPRTGGKAVEWAGLLALGIFVATSAFSILLITGVVGG